MGKYCGTYAPAVGLILKCHAAGWGPGKIADQIGHAIERGWLPSCDPTKAPIGPSGAVVRNIIKRETESQKVHAHYLALLVYRRYVRRHPVISRPLDMGGLRDVWINGEVVS